MGNVHGHKVACSCGRTYTQEEFRRLLIIGIQPDGAGGAFEIRQCECGISSISVELPAAKPGLAKARARSLPSPTPAATAEALLAAFYEQTPSTGVCMPFGVYRVQVAS